MPLPRDTELVKLPENPSDDFKRRNPTLYPLGALAPAKREPSQKPALEQKPRARQGSKGGLVIRCSIIAFRHRLLDDDNHVAGCKPLRDAVARMFGLDDADARITFSYSQHRSDGDQGTLVVIERH